MHCMVFHVAAIMVVIWSGPAVEEATQNRGGLFKLSGHIEKVHSCGRTIKLGGASVTSFLYRLWPRLK